MSLPTIYEEKTEFQPLPPDVYHATLLSIEPKDGQYGPFWTWKFEVDESEVPEGDYSTWQWAFSNCNLHPKSTSKKSPRAFASALVGRDLNDDEFIEEGGAEYEALVGKKCRLSLGIEKTQEGKSRNRVLGVLPLKVNKAKEASPLSARYMELGQDLKKYPEQLAKFKTWYALEYRGKFEEQTPAAQEEILQKMTELNDVEF